MQQAHDGGDGHEGQVGQAVNPGEAGGALNGDSHVIGVDADERQVELGRQLEGGGE